MPKKHDAEDPDKCPNYVVREELFVTHRAHSGDERGKSADQRQEPGKQNGFGAMPFIKRMGLIQMLAIENSAVWIAEEPVTNR